LVQASTPALLTEDRQLWRLPRRLLLPLLSTLVCLIGQPAAVLEGHGEESARG